MLYERLRAKDSTGLIYHYCSPSTFVKIIQNKTLRFSDLNMLNDGEEGRWGYNIFERAATLYLRREVPSEFPEIDREFLDEIDKIWSSQQFGFMSFISCFSSEGDSLSQWRAYADDGRGFAIGFRASEVSRLPLQVLDVLYDEDQQVKEMLAALASIRAEFNDEGRDFRARWFFERCALLAASSVALKNPAWRDEKEVRAQHAVTVKISESAWTLEDKGGTSAGRKVKGQSIQFEVRGSSIVAYLDLPFEVTKARRPIEEIVVGPKSSMGPGNIQFLLGNSGYGTIPLRVAGAHYR